MVDTKTFSDRLARALEANELDNATFARLLGENGQQNIRAWKDRGRVGSRSERKVAEILKRTNMEWLQYGSGQPERFSHAPEPSHNHDVRQARPVRPVPEILSSAYQYALIGLGLYAEARDLNLALLPDSLLLCDVYALIAEGGGTLPQGGESPELRAAVEKYAGKGSRDDRTALPAGPGAGNHR